MGILKEDLDININFGELCQQLDVRVSLNTLNGKYGSMQQLELLQFHSVSLSDKLKSSISGINKIKPTGRDIKRCIADTIGCNANDYVVRQSKCVYDIGATLCIFYTIRLAKKLFRMGLADVPTVIVGDEVFRVMEISVSAKLKLKSPQSNYVF